MIGIDEARDIQFVGGRCDANADVAPAVAKYAEPVDPICVVEALPVMVRSEPSKVRFASSTIALVPLPVRRRLLVNEVAPVPPFPTPSVPVMSVVRSTSAVATAPCGCFQETGERCDGKVGGKEIG